MQIIESRFLESLRKGSKKYVVAKTIANYLYVRVCGEIIVW